MSDVSNNDVHELWDQLCGFLATKCECGTEAVLMKVRKSYVDGDVIDVLWTCPKCGKSQRQHYKKEGPCPDESNLN